MFVFSLRFPIFVSETWTFFPTYYYYICSGIFSNSMTEEAMLFRRVQEGCWEAFDVLFHTYAEQLFFYAMGFVNNREEARDIVQGTFITL